jgi:hypothetical protein
VVGRVCSFVTLSVLLPLAVVAQEDESLGIYVLARTIKPLSRSERQARETELKEKSSELSHARKALERELKAAHGKKRDAWPPDAKAAYERAEEAASMAKSEIEILENSSPQEVLDSVVAIQRSIADGYRVFGLLPLPRRRATFLRQATSAAEADLTLEVMGRWVESDSSEDGTNYDVLIVRISPAETLVPEKLEAIARDGKSPHWRGGGLHSYRADEPFWTGKVTVADELFRNAADRTVQILEKFVEENFVALSARRR